MTGRAAEHPAQHHVVAMFADQPAGGSLLGVVPGAASLSTETMRAIAAGLGTDETAFVLPPSDDASYRVRVFTPRGESPHGGHSAVGTAATLVRLGLVPAGPVVQECGATQQVLTAQADRATLTGRFGTEVTPLAPEPLLAVTGLGPADIVAPGPGSAGFAFLPVRADALARTRPDYPRMRAEGLPAVCVVAWAADRRLARVRLFAPGFDIPEDPACGPIAMALGAWLAGTGSIVDRTFGYTVSQGVEMGRPARLDCTVTVSGGLADCTVTGLVTPTALDRTTATR
jgi:trans-2,3-dihydro-3-hydroxyanthranilate isomerase